MQFNPWSRADKKRLYVSDDSKEKVGYLDLVTLEQHPEKGREQELRDALAQVVGLPAPSPGPVEVSEAEMDSMFSDPSPASLQLPYQDHALRTPGASIENQEGDSYRNGVIGEQRTAGVLAPLHHQGYRTLHSIPLTERKDIDHLVIGPTGIHVLNTKSITYRATVSGDDIKVDGYRQTWVSSTEQSAYLASQKLTAFLRHPVTVQHLVVIWSPLGVEGSSSHAIAGENLVDHLTSLPQALDLTQVEGIFSQARRSDAWDVSV